MSSARSELENKIREHFQDETTASVEAILSDGIDRVNEDIKASHDQNRKKRLKAIRKKLLEWQVRLAALPISVDTSVFSASAAGGDDGNSSSRRTTFSPIPGCFYTSIHGSDYCLNCCEDFKDGDEIDELCSLPCSDNHRNSRFCKTCMTVYLETCINGGSVLKCPQILCPETNHADMPPGHRPLLSYVKWSKLVSEAMLNKYFNLAEVPFKGLVCGSCHNSKSQLVPFDKVKYTAVLESFEIKEEEETAAVAKGVHIMQSLSGWCIGCNRHGPSEKCGYQRCFLCNLCSNCCLKSYNMVCTGANPEVSKPSTPKREKSLFFVDIRAFSRSLEAFELRKLSEAAFHDEIFTTHLQPHLKSLNDDYKKDFEGLKTVLCLIEDPERRSTLQQYHLNVKNPRFDTLCCGRLHCFRCKTRDFHEGRSCAKNMDGMDSSVLPCPKCFVFLAKGDGCDSVTCVCGHRFNWPSELKKYSEIMKFATAFPSGTAEICADLLCGIRHGADVDFHLNQLNALGWRQHNTSVVDKLILAAWQKRFPINANEVVAKFILDEKSEERFNVHSIVKTIWRSFHNAKVDKALKVINGLRLSVLNCLYPTPLDKRNALAYFTRFEAIKEETEASSKSLSSACNQCSFGKLSRDEVKIFVELKKYRDSPIGRARFKDLKHQRMCQSALKFLSLHGNDQVFTPYKLSPLKEEFLSSIGFETGLKRIIVVGSRVELVDNYRKFRDAGGGPLRPGVSGVVTSMSGDRVLVRRWCYPIQALRVAEGLGTISTGKTSTAVFFDVKGNEAAVRKFYTSKGDATSTSFSSSSSSGGGGVGGGSNWDCGSCSYTNHGGRSSCEMCRTRKQEQEVALKWGIGDEVVLSKSYHDHDGSDGPLLPGDIAVIEEIDGSKTPYKVRGERGAFWYKEGALSGNVKRNGKVAVEVKYKQFSALDTKLFIEFRKVIEAVHKKKGQVPRNFRKMLGTCPSRGNVFARATDGSFVKADEVASQVASQGALCASGDVERLLYQVTWKDYFYDLINIDRYRPDGSLSQSNTKEDIFRQEDDDGEDEGEESDLDEDVHPFDRSGRRHGRSLPTRHQYFPQASDDNEFEFEFEDVMGLEERHRGDVWRRGGLEERHRGDIRGRGGLEERHRGDIRGRGGEEEDLENNEDTWGRRLEREEEDLVNNEELNQMLRDLVERDAAAASSTTTTTASVASQGTILNQLDESNGSYGSFYLANARARLTPLARLMRNDAFSDNFSTLEGDNEDEDTATVATADDELDDDEFFDDDRLTGERVWQLD